MCLYLKNNYAKILLFWRSWKMSCGEEKGLNASEGLAGEMWESGGSTQSPPFSMLSKAWWRTLHHAWLIFYTRGKSRKAGSEGLHSRYLFLVSTSPTDKILAKFWWKYVWSAEMSVYIIICKCNNAGRRSRVPWKMTRLLIK